MIVEPPCPSYIYLIDTDQYAGNFEREVVAYATGCASSEDRYAVVAGHYRTAFPEDYRGRYNSIMYDVVAEMPDYQGFMCVAGIGGTPVQVGQETQHRSVVIYLVRRPSDELLRRWLDRAREYLDDPQKYDSHEFVPRATVFGARLLRVERVFHPEWAAA